MAEESITHRATAPTYCRLRLAPSSGERSLPALTSDSYWRLTDQARQQLGSDEVLGYT